MRTSNNWNKLWWLLGSVLFPISLPYVIVHFYNQFLQRKNKNNLPGKVVVITGASSGLGEALAHTFYMAGCKVVLAARRMEELERVRRDLLEIHSLVPTHPPVVIQIDLSDLNSLQGKVDEILQIFGHIDILINNGGVSVRGDILSTTVDVDIKVMVVNYFGAVSITKAVLPSMIKRNSGHIISVSSVQGKFAIPYRSSYTASKHALQAFCDSLRAEIGQHNVKVLVVSPGYINTALSLNALTGSGKTYGVTDAATAGGANADQVSEDILNAMLCEENDVILAPMAPKIAYLLRYICPSIYFWVMDKRARKIDSKKD